MFLLSSCVLCVALTAAPTPATSSKEVRELIDKALSAYGGEKALSGARVVRQTGQVASTMRGGPPGTLVRTFVRPDRLRVEISYAGQPGELRVLDKGHCWRGGVEVEGPQRDAVLLQAARLALPLSLHERLAEVADLGAGKVGETPVRVLGLSLQADLVLRVELDPKTGRILRSVGRSAHGLEFVAEYGDFRKVGGLLYPFSETTFAMGNKTSDITLDKVEMLAAVPEEAFPAAPEGSTRVKL